MVHVVMGWVGSCRGGWDGSWWGGWVMVGWGGVGHRRVG